MELENDEDIFYNYTNEIFAAPEILEYDEEADGNLVFAIADGYFEDVELAFFGDAAYLDTSTGEIKNANQIERRG